VAVAILGGLLVPAGAGGASAAGADREGTVVAAVRTPRGGRLVCVDARGEDREVGVLGLDPSDAGFVGDRLWATSTRTDDPHVAAVDPVTGRVTRASNVTGPTDAVVSAGDRVWVRTIEGALLPVDPRTGATGEPVATPAIPKHVAASPHALWAASEDGSVFAIDARTGELDGAVLRVKGTSTDAPVIGALATDGRGTLWIALHGESLLLGVDERTRRITKRIRYEQPVPDDARPATALAVSGRYAWIGIDNAAETVPVPTLVRVDLRSGTVRSFEALTGTGIEKIAADGPDVWFAGDGVAHFDARTNRFTRADLDITLVAALLDRPCTTREKVPTGDQRASEDADALGGPRRTAAELRAIDYGAFVVTDLPPEFDSPPRTADLAGEKFRLVLCNQVVEGPTTYTAGIEYDRPGPEFVEQAVSGWPGEQANEIFDRAREAVAECKPQKVRQFTFRPVASPPVPDDLGDEHLVLSRSAGEDIVFTQLLVRKGQFLSLVEAHEQLPGIAPQVGAQLDRLAEGG
jgi:outer membrane protein assembly factor BamB